MIKKGVIVKSKKQQLQNVDVLDFHILENKDCYSEWHMVLQPLNWSKMFMIILLNILCKILRFIANLKANNIFKEENMTILIQSTL